MKITIDTDAMTVAVDRLAPAPLYSRESFEVLSDIWLKVGWDQKYPYTFSWMGMPILQIPEDMIRMQEVIVGLRPDLIIETGVAHGGSMIFYASLCKLLGHGRVIGIEKGLRCRQVVNTHPLGGNVLLIEGDSTAPDIVDRVHTLARGLRVLVILDSNHSKEHVARELEAYHDLVQPGSYIVATDGNMKDLAEVPRGKPEWREDNPQAAAIEFAQRHPDFVIEQPAWPFNESSLARNVTYWPSAWLRRLSLAEQHHPKPHQKRIHHEQAHGII